MIEVVAMVCFINDPSKCKDVHLNFAAEIGNPAAVHDVRPDGAREVDR